MSGIFGSSSTVTSESKLPRWIEDFAKQGLEDADDVSANLTPPYQGQRVADLNSGQENALDAVQGVIGRSSGQFGQAAQGAGGVMQYQPGQVQAGNFLQGDVGGYMSPYTQQVEEHALGRLDEQRQQAINQTGDQAIASNAFGGSRHGLMEGVVNAESAKNAGQLSAGLRDEAYKNAQGMMNTDMNRQLSADSFNETAGLQGADTRLRASGYLGDLATADQSSFLQGAQASLASGNQRQSQSQAGLDTDHQLYNEMRAFPGEQLDIRLNALGMTPYGQSKSTTSPSNSNPLMAGVGGALAGAQLSGMLGFGSGVGALGGAALGMLSDEDEKENIKKLGKDPESGLPMYTYNYKDDAKSAPKRVGPMAQDIEKIRPDMVKTIGGKKVVMNMGFGGGG